MHTAVAVPSLDSHNNSSHNSAPLIPLPLSSLTMIPLHAGDKSDTTPQRPAAETKALTEADAFSSLAAVAVACSLAADLDLPPLEAHPSKSVPAIMGAPRPPSSTAAAAPSRPLPPFPLSPRPLQRPTPALLDSGAPDNSSSHLSLIALDPRRSVMSRAALNRMKLRMVRGGDGAEAAGVREEQRRKRLASLCWKERASLEERSKKKKRKEVRNQVAGGTALLCYTSK